MTLDQQQLYQKEISNLEPKGLIQKSASPLSRTTFYVNNAPERERGVLRLVINYKPLNKVLQSIRFSIPNIQDIIH